MNESIGNNALTLPEHVALMEGISKRFGATQALVDADLAIRRGTAHALVGRNGAGKSTLVSILTGLLEPDSGSITIDGTHLSALERVESDQIACVYQRPQILDHLTVAENLFIGRRSRQWVARRSLYTRANSVLEQWGIDINSRLVARDLNAEQRQMVEIARALTGKPSLVVLDEPTAQLDRNAIDRLFGKLDEMKKRGVSFLFISHHLEELFVICEEVTAMRDGITVARGLPTSDLTAQDLVDLMVGGEDASTTHTAAPSRDHDASSPILSVRDLSSDAFTGVNFDVRAGEIVGLAGLGGSGKREVGEAIVGLHKRAGEVRIDGVPLRSNNVRESITAGVGYIPEDRHESGFAPALSISDNLVTTVLGSLGRFGWIRPARKRARTSALLNALDIVPRDSAYPVGSLSGGNQQKVVVGRALAPTPRVIVGLTPTAGVDVASKQFLYSTLEYTAAEGAAVLIISDEIDELAIADRVLVMFDGKLTREYARGWSAADLIGAIEGVSPLVTGKEG